MDEGAWKVVEESCSSVHSCWDGAESDGLLCVGVHMAQAPILDCIVVPPALFRYHAPPSQVPTFLFYRNGQEVGRHVGSSRGDLIGQILAQQAKVGIQPPPSNAAAAQKRERRPMRRGRIKLER